MVVYPTRRSASFPQRTYDYTRKNAPAASWSPTARACRVAPRASRSRCPSSAKELIWNHKLKYKGLSVLAIPTRSHPTAGGAYTLIKLKEEVLGLYYKPGNTTESINNILLYFKQKCSAGAPGRPGAAGARDPQCEGAAAPGVGLQPRPAPRAAAPRTSPTTTRAPRPTACAPMT
jgi:hypothetical protein